MMTTTLEKLASVQSKADVVQEVQEVLSDQTETLDDDIHQRVITLRDEDGLCL